MPFRRAGKAVNMTITIEQRPVIASGTLLLEAGVDLVVQQDGFALAILWNESDEASLDESAGMLSLPTNSTCDLKADFSMYKIDGSHIELRWALETLNGTLRRFSFTAVVGWRSLFDGR